MPSDLTRPTIHYGDDDVQHGDEHLRPAWQAVLATVVLIATSALVLAFTG